MTSIGLPEARTVVNVLATGSRYWTDREVILTALRSIEADAVWTTRGPYRFRLIHGACPLRPVEVPDPDGSVQTLLGSADMLAQSVARQLRWEIVESRPGVRGFPADWKRHGSAAGPLRNQQMVGYLARMPADRKVCVGFPLDGLDVPYEGPLPEFGGTWDCLDRARKAGIRTWWAYPGFGSSPEVAA